MNFPVSLIHLNFVPDFEIRQPCFPLLFCDSVETPAGPKANLIFGVFNIIEPINRHCYVETVVANVCCRSFWARRAESWALHGWSFPPAFERLSRMFIVIVTFTILLTI